MMIFVSVAAVLWATALLDTAQANLFSSFRSEERPGDDIEALCSGHRIDLTTYSQLQVLNRRVSDCSDCSEYLTGAIHELSALIEHGKTDLCSVKSIENLQSYYTKYLDTSEHGSSSKHKELLSKSLRRFVLAYGMQTSNLCKRNMAKVLSEQSPGVLSESRDQEMLEQITGDQGPVAQVLGVLGAGGSPDEIFMPGDLTPLLRRHGFRIREPGGDKLFLQTATGPYIKRLQSLCEHQYKPVYEPLMLPLVRLASMGFNYRDAPRECQPDCPKIQPQVVGRWSRIVLLCEALVNIEIVEESSGHEEGQAKLRQGIAPVRILTKEEASVLKRASSHEEQVPIAFEAPTSERVVLGDLVYDRANKNLLKSVRRFKTNWSVDKNLRKRMIRKGLALAKDQLRQGHYGVVISAAYKGLIRRQSVVTNPSELVVKSLDEMIQRNGTAAANPTKSKSDNFKVVLYEAYAFVVCIAITIALISSFFLGILV